MRRGFKLRTSSFGCYVHLPACGVRKSSTAHRIHAPMHSHNHNCW